MSHRADIDEVLLERYAETKNAVLCAELGVSERTLERHRAVLGIQKSEAFIARCSREGLEEIEYRRLIGQRMGGVRKGSGKSRSSTSFRKGHKFDAATERKRIKAIQDRAWDERMRMHRGMKRNTGWKFHEDYGD